MASFTGYKRGQNNNLSQFYTPEVLAKYTAEIANTIARKKYNNKQVTMLDPCVGGGALYQWMKEPKIAADIDIRNFKQAIKQDFLTATRQTYGVSREEKLIICMNPPFSINKKPWGVVRFLNKCQEILNVGEYVVSIAGLKERQDLYFQEVSPYLHLKKEIIFRQPLTFVEHKLDKDGNELTRDKKQNVMVRIWKKKAKLQERPKKFSKKDLQKSDEIFTLGYTHKLVNPDVRFYIRSIGTLRLLGAIEEEAKLIGISVPKKKDLQTLPGKEDLISKIQNEKINIKTSIGTFNKKGGSGSFIAVIIKDSNNIIPVKRKMQKIYASGVYCRFSEYAKTGNNPGLNFEIVKRAYLNFLERFSLKNVKTMYMNLKTQRQGRKNVVVGFEKDERSFEIISKCSKKTSRLKDEDGGKNVKKPLNTMKKEVLMQLTRLKF